MNVGGIVGIVLGVAGLGVVIYLGVDQYTKVKAAQAQADASAANLQGEQNRAELGISDEDRLPLERDLAIGTVEECAAYAAQTAPAEWEQKKLTIPGFGEGVGEGSMPQRWIRRRERELYDECVKQVRLA
jgi:hypothetical protein